MSVSPDAESWACSGIDWLDEHDLMALRAEDEDLGDDDDDLEQFNEWEMPDEEEMRLPGCTPERTRQIASPFWPNFSSSTLPRMRSTPPVGISSPLKKRILEELPAKSRKGRRTPSPSPQIALAAALAAPAASPPTASPPPFVFRPPSRPASRLGRGRSICSTPTPTKLTMRFASTGAAIKAAAEVAAVKRSAAPFGVRQGPFGHDALRNINKMVNKQKQKRAASRSSGAATPTPTPPNADSRPATPSSAATAAAAEDKPALPSFTAAPPTGAAPAPSVPMRFRQFGALGGGTLVACPSSTPAPPAEKPGAAACFTVGGDAARLGGPSGRIGVTLGGSAGLGGISFKITFKVCKGGAALGVQGRPGLPRPDATGTAAAKLGGGRLTISLGAGSCRSTPSARSAT